jgi:transcriptional accessory protein Tex/SPT6
MTATKIGSTEKRAAETLGLRAPAYAHLRDALESGEYPLWLRIADPMLAGLFPDPFAFEILCEKVRLRAGFERRLENLRGACEKAGRADLIEALDQAEDEGELEDVGFALSAVAPAAAATPAPTEGEPAAPEASAAKPAEGLDAYLAHASSDFRTAAALRSSFREHATLAVAATDKEGVEAKPFQSLMGWNSSLATVPPAKYLQMRRGERAHAVLVSFEWPQAELARLAEQLGGFPPQERDKYVQAFVNFAREERMPRFVQEARASLKRTAETEALRNAWEQIDFALNRGRHQGPVLGLCAARGGKVQASLIDADGEFVRAAQLQPKSSDFESGLRGLLGDVRPELIAYQGDTASRNLAQRLVKLIPGLDTVAPKPKRVAAPEVTPEVAPEVTPAADPAAAAESPVEAPVEAAAPAQEPVAEEPAAAVVEPAAEASEAAEAAEPKPAAPKHAKSAAKPAAKKAALKSRVRQAHVPMSVARTLQREVARRGAETLLSHDERTAYLVARFAWDPRGAALATPHVVRSFISFRGEVNPRRLEEFEVTFLRSLLVEKGVEANSASLDVLRMVPGLDADGAVIERSTGEFLSLEDLLDRVGLEGAEARAALCLLRVRSSKHALDSRALHPVYFPALRAAAAAGGMEIADLLKDPYKINDLPWDDILRENGWHKSVLRTIREGLERGGSRRRRRGPAGGPGAGAPGPKQARGPRGPRAPRRGTKGLDTLEVGAKMQGRITAVTEYGAFVDVGARTEGLVHISEMSDEFVEDPKEVVKVGQEVEARIVSVDLEKQRFRLSLRSEDAPRGRQGGGGGGGGGGFGRHEEVSDPNAPAYVRSTRPKGQGGGRGGAGGGRGRGGPGGPGGFGGGRDGGRPGGGKGRGRDESYGKDPKAKKKEEIDPTNPFFQFFSQDKDSDQK